MKATIFVDGESPTPGKVTQLTSRGAFVEWKKDDKKGFEWFPFECPAQKGTFCAVKFD